MSTELYTIDFREDEHGVEHPNEALWIPSGKDAEESGFINSDGLLIAGVGQEGELPAEFIALGHGHTWTAIYQAALEYMRRVWGWRDLQSETGVAPNDNVARIPLPDRKHAVFIRHPHPDHPCGCEWDGQWRLVYVDPSGSGAVPVTAMRRPGGAR
ncbi:hypothetical protein FHS39_002527 [Streptomyces olivoverticillatus]|uniref:Uncharacterized protein n=1 Tax=Streptomyces olivoverticillatus TaxID=66427 RepID=A0A7W7PJT6_9ACTN|nr:hypothetical protein [Streptomyces olivoverticillatus]MBB4893496.1 hypothetical protein [Streptomyces olivoverticillatus]